MDIYTGFREQDAEYLRNNKKYIYIKLIITLFRKTMTLLCNGESCFLPKIAAMRFRDNETWPESNHKFKHKMHKHISSQYSLVILGLLPHEIKDKKTKYGKYL